MTSFHSTYFFLISLLVSLAFPLCAQQNQLRAYTLEDGLPQSQVYDIIQDEMGYLWLGTQGGGICRFDGKAFKVWNEEDGLLSNFIHTLYSSNDSLFVGTKRGLSIKIKNGFHNIPSPQINKIYCSEGVMFLATNKGIFQYQALKGLSKLKLHSQINNSAIHDITFDREFYWIATNNGLWKLNTLSDSPSFIKKMADNNFTAVVFHNDKVFAATFTNGIQVIEPTSPKTPPLIISDLLHINHISIINEQLWVSTLDDGIRIFDSKNYHEINTLNKKSGLSIKHIRKSIKDRQSNIWIATSGGGFYKYFQNNFTHFDRETGLKGNRVYAVHAAKNGIWISNSEAGLVQIDSMGIRTISKDEHFPEVKIKTITADSNGNIWAGTDGKGIIFRETIKKDSIVIDSSLQFGVKRDTIVNTFHKSHYISTKTGFPSDWIRTILIKNDTIWAATYSDGIIPFKYYSEKDSLVILKKYNYRSGIKDLLIRDMKKDHEGRIWYATQKGHLGYIHKNKVTHLANILNQKIPINSLLFYKNTLFIGTLGKGVWWSNLHDNASFEKLSGLKQPYSNNIYQLVFDEGANLWVGTEQGVDKVVLSQDNKIEDVFHFGRNEGFLGIETCLNAIAKDDNGNLWFGAIKGLTKYQAGEMIKTTMKPSIQFENVEIDYQIVDSIHLNQWTNSPKTLQLKPNQTQISFIYRTVDINHPDEVQYRFKLNESEWSPWSVENKQNLVGLAYGQHVFLAQSRNFRWIESDPVSFRFFIESPLYKKLWFQWTVVALVIFIIALIVYFYIKRIQFQNKKEQERLQMKNHLLSLEQKALQLQMNPHFIFNVLNGIKAMAINNPKKMNTTINTFATLLREILNNSRKETITLAQEIKALKHYIEIEQLMAPKDFIYEIIIESLPDLEEVLIPPMLIQPFVENSIRHGILKGNRKGKLQIKFIALNDFLSCVIIDNGIGIFHSQKNKAKTDHQSMALQVTKERLAYISGENALEINEIIKDGNTIGGTQVSFKIPLETDY